MPARARREIMDFSSVGAYHCYSRCVRRAFLCGRDDYSGNTYDHRKDWPSPHRTIRSQKPALLVLPTTGRAANLPAQRPSIQMRPSEWHRGS